MAGNGVILFDASGNPIAGYGNTALASVQPALLHAGQDYASPPKAQIPKIDALGQQYAVPVASNGQQLPIGVGATTPAPSAALGQISLAWSPSNGTWVPFAVDASGAGIVRQSISPTFSTTAQQTTGTAAGKSMVSFMNTGTQVHRFVGIYAICPPQVNTTGGLIGIGSGTTYTQIFFALYRITGHTGGTVLTPQAHDMVDTLDAGFTARTGAAIQGESSAQLLAWDAGYNAETNVAGRLDNTAKLIKLWPGQGLHVKCLTSLSASVTFVIGVRTLQDAT